MRKPQKKGLLSLDRVSPTGLQLMYEDFIGCGDDVLGCGGLRAGAGPLRARARYIYAGGGSSAGRVLYVADGDGTVRSRRMYGEFVSYGGASAGGELAEAETAGI